MPTCRDPRRAVRQRTALSVLALAVAASACDIVTADFRSKESAEWRKTFTLQAGGRVEIANVNGLIDAAPSDGRTVEVVAVKTARASTPEAAKAALERIEILEDVSPAAVKIETRAARGGGLFNGGGAEVRYTVKVPADAEVRFTTVNGGIELSRLAGRITAQTTNGGVRASGIAGPIEASTTNGGLEIELTRVAEPGVRLECTNGGISLRLPADAKATLSATVANGGIDVTKIEGMSVETTQTSRRRLEARLNGGGPAIRLAGTNGGIEIGPGAALER